MKRFLLGLAAHAATAVVTIGLMIALLQAEILDLSVGDIEAWHLKMRDRSGESRYTFSAFSGLSLETNGGSIQLGEVNLNVKGPIIAAKDARGDYRIIFRANSTDGRDQFPFRETGYRNEH